MSNAAGDHREIFHQGQLGVEKTEEHTKSSEAEVNPRKNSTEGYPVIQAASAPRGAALWREPRMRRVASGTGQQSADGRADCEVVFYSLEA